MMIANMAASVNALSKESAGWPDVARVRRESLCGCGFIIFFIISSMLFVELCYIASAPYCQYRTYNDHVFLDSDFHIENQMLCFYIRISFYSSPFFINHHPAPWSIGCDQLLLFSISLRRIV